MTDNLLCLEGTFHAALSPATGIHKSARMSVFCISNDAIVVEGITWVSSVRYLGCSSRYLQHLSCEQHPSASSFPRERLFLFLSLRVRRLEPLGALSDEPTDRRGGVSRRTTDEPTTQYRKKHTNSCLFQKISSFSFQSIIYCNTNTCIYVLP
jgi:hypothetical protein